MTRNALWQSSWNHPDQIHKTHEIGFLQYFTLILVQIWPLHTVAMVGKMAKDKRGSVFSDFLCTCNHVSLSWSLINKTIVHFGNSGSKNVSTLWSISHCSVATVVPTAERARCQSQDTLSYNLTWVRWEHFCVLNAKEKKNIYSIVVRPKSPSKAHVLKEKGLHTFYSCLLMCV